MHKCTAKNESMIRSSAASNTIMDASRHCLGANCLSLDLDTKCLGMTLYFRIIPYTSARQLLYFRTTASILPHVTSSILPHDSFYTSARQLLYFRTTASILPHDTLYFYVIPYTSARLLLYFRSTASLLPRHTL